MNDSGPDTTQERGAAWLKRLLGFVIVLGALTAVSYHQEISDWWYLRSYVPPERIEQFAKEANLTEQGRTILYRADPQIQPKAALDAACAVVPKEGGGGGDLHGCFTGSRIYILQLPKEELQSEMVVTAAHEMLHAALGRLTRTEWQDLVRGLEEQYRALDDPELEKYLRAYSDPESRQAELHSVLGTEYRSLSPELESHYRRYFTNRSGVLAAHERFEAVFDSLERELEDLNSQIRSLERRMKAYEASGDYRSYNSLVDPINELIRRYNQKVAQFNELTLNAKGEIRSVPGR